MVAQHTILRSCLSGLVLNEPFRPARFLAFLLISHFCSFLCSRPAPKQRTRTLSPPRQREAPEDGLPFSSNNTLIINFPDLNPSSPMQQRNPGIYGARLSDGDAIKCPKPNNQCWPMPFGKVVIFFGVAEGIATHCLICVLTEERMALMPLSPPGSSCIALCRFGPSMEYASQSTL